MKPYIITACLAITVSFTAKAQDHKAAIKQTADLYVAAVLKHDYAASFQYEYPGRIAYYGGMDSLLKRIQAEDKQNAAQNVQLKNILLGEPGQVAKYGAILYSVVPDTIIFQFPGETDMGLSTSIIALSADDGKSWKLATIENMEWLTSVLPDVSKLDIPKPIQLGILDSKDKPQSGNSRDFKFLGRRALADVVITHNEEYLADPTSMKIIKVRWIKSTSIGILIAKASDTLKYGKDAANGINRYYINDEKYPKAYPQIVKIMKYIGAAEPEVVPSDH